MKTVCHFIDCYSSIRQNELTHMVDVVITWTTPVRSSLNFSIHLYSLLHIVHEVSDEYLPLCSDEKANFIWWNVL